MGKNKKYIVGIGILVVLITGYFIMDSLLFNGIKPTAINEYGFQANYFAKTDTKNKAAIVLIGGGQWGDYWGQQFANKGFSGLSLPYIGREGLPTLPEEIDLEYFQNAMKWLGEQPEVDSNKIIVMGASRNAELALLIASTFPELVNGVVAYAPSSVSWPNTVLSYNSDDLKPSWKYQGVGIPYVPMDKISGNNSNKIQTLKYWVSGLAKTNYVTQALIKVERINGPILLFSGKDDKVWPSAKMADMIENRLNKYDFKFPFQSIKYENSGHLISSDPEMHTDVRTGKMKIDGKDFEYEFGGTLEGDKRARYDSYKRLMDYISKL